MSKLLEEIQLFEICSTEETEVFGCELETPIPLPAAINSLRAGR